uniref:Uncharacterized protein n=1 Tax=Nicotiana tabacum TaxID=4097 RepID=A0A1S4C188_TOBAC|nr:PREDICTED: uncharacterized protein LOC107814096 [Nicotiana tabacum]
MALYSSTIINYHLDAIQGLMMDNNTHMLNLLDNIENKLSASSKTIPEAPKHIDMAVCLDDKSESEEFSGAEIDSDLDKGRSSPANNFEFLIEMVETESDDGENLKGYDYKVFAEIPNKKTDVKVEDSLKTYLVKPETQVFDEMFQITSPIKWYFRDHIMFDNPLALPCMLSVCGHNLLISRGTFDYLSDLGHVILILSLHRCPPNQFELYFPFDPGSSLFITFLGTTRKDICCGALSNLTHAKFMTLTMCNFFIAPLGLHTQSS